MAKRNRVRFYVSLQKANGRHVHRAALYSIHQSSSQDLIITVIPNNFFEYELFETVRQKEHRYSIHVSPNSSGHTINEHVVLDGGDRITYSQLVECQNQPLLAHIASKRWASLAFAKFEMKNREADTLIKIANYDEQYNNIVAHLFVCDHGLGQQFRQTFGGFLHEFSYFDIILIPYFMGFESIEQGDSMRFMTSEPAFNGNRTEAQYEPIKSFSFDDIPDIISTLNHQLSVQFNYRNVQISANAPGGIFASVEISQNIREMRKTPFLPLL